MEGEPKEGPSHCLMLLPLAPALALMIVLPGELPPPSSPASLLAAACAALALWVYAAPVRAGAEEPEEEPAARAPAGDERELPPVPVDSTTP